MVRELERLLRPGLFLLGAACLLSVPGSVHAQFGATDWTTTGFDAQRSFWVRSDPKISVSTMRAGGFELVWKINVNEGARQKSFVMAPVLLDFYISYRGFRSLGFIGSPADSVVATDTDLGRVEWRKDFQLQRPPSSSPQCPGGMTSGVARPSTVAYPAVITRGGFGRSTPAKSGVGEPFEGAVTLKQISNEQMTAPPPAPRAAGRTRRISVPENPYAPRIQWLHVLTSDGRLHSLYVSNGEEPARPLSFLAAQANAKGLLVAENVAYVATSNGCGGVANGIWSLDLSSSGVKHWKSAGNVAGTAGMALGPDGTVYAAAGNELVALQDRTLERVGSYKIGNQAFTSSPVVFEFKGKDLIAATSNDGKLHLLGAPAIDHPLAVTPAFSTADFETGAVASWQDGTGTRWLLVPAAGATAAKAGFKGTADVKNGAITAWKVVDRGGTPALEPGWISRDLSAPLTPIVVNDMVFAISRAETGTNASNAGSTGSSSQSAPAVLYALEAATGKEMWNSGNTLTSSVRPGGLAAGGSRVYVTTEDGTAYVFGFPIEH
jgi:hypothetical protein